MWRYVPVWMRDIFLLGRVMEKAGTSDRER